jgi:hypothetical protein
VQEKGFGGQMGNDRYSKRLRIGITVQGTTFLLLNGDPLPQFRAGAFAELIIDEDAIEEPKARTKFTQDRVVKIIDKDSSIFVGVSPQMVEDSMASRLNRSLTSGRYPAGYWFVEVRLRQALCIRIRGDQEAKLERCDCYISALNKTAVSINHAFTLVSEEFERKRQSHTGNVFERVFTLAQDGWLRLDDLRRSAVAEAFET